MAESLSSLPMLVVKIDDKFKIPGESLLAGHVGEIDAWHFQHGLTMPMVADKSSNSRTSGRCRHDDFTFWLPMSKAYPKLMEACARGVNLGQVLVQAVKKSEGEMRMVTDFKLTDAYVSSVSFVHMNDTPLKAAAPAAGGGAMVKFALNYQELVITYNEYDATGAHKGAVASEKITGT